MKKNDGTVYLICDTKANLYKIGMTKSDVQKRLKQLQTGNGTELVVIQLHHTEYPFRIESMLHKHFRSKNVLNEWYDLSEYDVCHFTQYCNEMENIIKVLINNPFFNKHLR